MTLENASSFAHADLALLLHNYQGLSIYAKINVIAGNNYTQLLGDHRIASLADLLAGPDRLGQPLISRAFDTLEAELAKSKSTAKQKQYTREMGEVIDSASSPPRTDSEKAAWRDAGEQGTNESMGKVKSLSPESIEVEASRQRAQEAAKYGPGRFSDKSRKLSAGRDEGEHGSK